jgi:xylan 1,4-beta-xylosidase
MRGNPDSGGVWAPDLSYADGQFWLVYSDVKALHGPFKDVRNYLVTAKEIEGPWSDPIPLNRSGFDPSLFHDDDGRKWLINQVWKSSLKGDAFAGIVLQEYSVSDHRLVGSPVNIFKGSPLGKTEGPHLYRKDGYYYLVTAEGGTEWDHAVTVARSRNLTGPYDVAPDNPMLTSRGYPKNRLQKAGHGSLVQTPEGEWMLAYLCARPVGTKRRCILGRETALQSVVWPKGGWPKLASGRKDPVETLEVIGVRAKPYMNEFVDEFNSARLDSHWNTLREPADTSWLTLAARPGFLRLRGRYSLQSHFDQSLIGFRLLHHRCFVTTRLDFSPVTFQQRAGLVLYYNTSNYHYLYITAAENGDREVGIMTCDNRRYREILERPLPIPRNGAVNLKAVLDGTQLQFAIGHDSLDEEIAVGPPIDATILSDDYPGEGGLEIAFTGAFAGLCSQDSSDDNVVADFDWFRYRGENVGDSNV